MTSQSAAPGASGTPMDLSVSIVLAHIEDPVDGCSLPCCRTTFTDHLGVVHVWSWTRAQWEAER